MVRNLQGDLRGESGFDRRGHGEHSHPFPGRVIANNCQASPGHVYSTLKGYVEAMG